MIKLQTHHVGVASCDLVELVEEDLSKVTIGRNVGQVDVDNVSPRVVGQGLDKTRLACSWNTTQQQPEFYSRKIEVRCVNHKGGRASEGQL